MSQSGNSVFVIYREGKFSVEEISRKLNLEPDRDSVSNELGRNSVWKLLCPNKASTLEGQIEYWIHLLLNKACELEGLKNEGWSIELDCLIQPDEGTAIISLEPELLQQVSSLHANLTIRVWD